MSRQKCLLSRRTARHRSPLALIDGARLVVRAFYQMWRPEARSRAFDAMRPTRACREKRRGRGLECDDIVLRKGIAELLRGSHSQPASDYVSDLDLGFREPEASRCLLAWVTCVAFHVDSERQSWRPRHMRGQAQLFLEVTVYTVLQIRSTLGAPTVRARDVGRRRFRHWSDDLESLLTIATCELIDRHGQTPVQLTCFCACAT